MITGSPANASVTLNDGVIIPAGLLAFNQGNYTFAANSAALSGDYSLDPSTPGYWDTDVTMQIPVSAKRAYWPDFDITTWNSLYEQQINPAAGGQRDTSTTGILLGQLYNNPLGATLEQGATVLTNTETSAITAANRVATTGLGELFKNPFVLLILVGGAYLLYANRDKVKSVAKKSKYLI